MLVLTKLYMALLEAGASEEKARRAAAAVVGANARWAAIERKLNVHTYLLAMALAMSLMILWKVSYRRHPACHPNRLLGSGAQTDFRQTAAGPLTGALRRLCGAARATSQKAVPDCAPAKRGARTPEATTGSGVVLRHALSCINTARFTGKQSYTIIT